MHCMRIDAREGKISMQKLIEVMMVLDTKATNKICLYT